jgi:GNAT superfamily N-acetyltransferase
MVDPLVRPATANDIAELGWLEQIARERLLDQRGGDLWLERHAIQSPDWGAAAAGRVLVGTIDGTIVGYLRFEQTDDVVYVRDVFVHPEAREVGFGDALLAATVDIARRNGARRIEAEALPGDRDTKNLYERAGITAKRITVSSLLADLDGA